MSASDPPLNTLFPITIDYIDVATGETIHTQTTRSPGIDQFPVFTDDHGPIYTRVTLGDGRTLDERRLR